MFPKHTLILVTVLGLALGGCSKSPAAVDPGTDDGSSATDAGPIGMPAGATPGAADPNAAAGAIGAPAGATAMTAASPPLQDLTATITKKAGGLFSKFGCTVEITNPNSVARTGKVTVTFTHNGAAESGSPAQTQDVSIEANGTKDIDFKDNKYHLLKEDATVEITTDPAPATSVAAPLAAAMPGGATAGQPY